MERAADMSAGNQTPLISIIMPTFNRAHTIARAIDSVLHQSYENFELIIVDDGSTDNTKDVLAGYPDPRIRIFTHERNKGVTAAKNLGLDAIHGEWFTILDSDDEMVPTALETFLTVSSTDRNIDAITCNCIDSVSGSFTGKGMDNDRYLDEDFLSSHCKGEHWGLTKTSLLGSDRLNEELPGWENTLWYKINAKATRYYIHKALRIYHTEGTDRITKANTSKTSQGKARQARIFRALQKERIFLQKTAQFDFATFEKMCVKGVIVAIACNDTEMGHYYHELLESNLNGKNTSGALIATLAMRGGQLTGIILYMLMTMRQRLKKS